MAADNPQKMKFKSPTGKMSTFDYEDTDHSVSVKSGVFENAAGNGTYVQSNGITGFRLPVTAIFHGKGYDKAAKYFVASVCEPGAGVLYHPVYDKEIYVKAVGDVVRTDNFVTGHGQALVSVQFYETSPLNIGKAENMTSIFDQMAAVSADDFAQKVRLSDAVDRESFKNRVTRLATTVKVAMKKASGTLSLVNNAIETTSDSIARNIDALVGSPLTLARQTQILIGEPRRQNDRIRDKLAAYANMAGDIFSSTIEEPNRYSNDIVNQFHLNKMTAQAIIANSAMLSVETGEYRVRSDYYNQALALIELMDSYQAWQDAGFSEIASTTVDESETDTGDGIEELLDLIRAACESLILSADNAQTAVRIKTETERTPIDLCYELNGTTAFDVLDEFIRVNSIVGDEFFLIPKGREIVYFI